MKKVCVVIASRANYARARSVMRAIQENDSLELITVLTASAVLYRYGDIRTLVEQDGFNISATSYTMVEGDTPSTMAKSTGLAMIELSTIFDRFTPDFVLTVADRYETLATAVAASYMNIPLVHTQGGDLSGSIDESVRHAITKLAHIHFPASELSRARVIKMGENPERVFNFGCPAMDEINYHSIEPLESEKINSVGTGDELDLSKEYLVLLEHPITTVYNEIDIGITESLKAIQELGIQTVILWPNVDAGSQKISKALRVFKEASRNIRVRFIRNLEITDYNRLIFHCRCLVGNSSSGIREAAFLGIPSVNVGDRQRFRERGNNVIDVPNNSENIKCAIKQQIDHGRYERDFRFGDGTAGFKIASKLSELEKINVQKEWYTNEE